MNSYVEIAPLSVKGVQPKDGNNALYVDYDNSGGNWQYASLNFPAGIDPIDLTGMREIHMWVYFLPDSEGTLSIRFDFPNGANMGTQTATKTGEWQELVWKIDRLTSDTLISSINYWGGFIVPDPTGIKGALYIDNIYAVRPAGIPEVQSLLLYGFNDKNTDNDAPKGWTKAVGDMPRLGNGEATPTEGSNYMVMNLGNSWIENVTTINAKNDFDRWPQVLEIMVDVQVSSEYTGTWAQSALVLKSGVNDADGNPVPDAKNVNNWDGYAELGYGDAKAWKTILWGVDMSKHIGAFENDGGWFNISLSSNNDTAALGQAIYFDNLRVSIPKTTAVSEWSLF